MNDSSNPTTHILNGASQVNIGTGTFSTVGRDQYNNYHTTHQTIVQNRSQTTVLNERVTTAIIAISGGAEVLQCLLRIFEHDRVSVPGTVQAGVAITSHKEALKDLKFRIACTVDVIIRYHDAVDVIEDQAEVKDFNDLFASFGQLLVEIQELVTELQNRPSNKTIRALIQIIRPLRWNVSTNAFLLRKKFINLQRTIKFRSERAITQKDHLATQGATYTAQDLHDAMENEIPRLKGLCDREIRLKLADIAMVYVQNRDRAWLIAIKFFNKYFTADASNPPNPTEQSPATEANATSDYPPPSHHHPVENIIEDLTRIGQIGGGSEPSEDPFNDPDHIRDNDSILSYWSNALYDFRD